MSNMLTDALMTDGIKWWPKVKVIKYNQSTIDEITKFIGHEPSGPELRWLEEHEGLKADDLAYAEGNLLTTAGVTRVAKLITGQAGNAFTNTTGFVGVGDRGGTASNTAAVGDVNLTATTNKYFQAPDASNPTSAAGVITTNTTFATGNANFAWNEWCWGIIDTGTLTPGATIPGTTQILLNHATPSISLGTKASGSWTLQATVTIS